MAWGAFIIALGLAMYVVTASRKLMGASYHPQFFYGFIGSVTFASGLYILFKVPA